jgi:hypothetical protein
MKKVTKAVKVMKKTKKPETKFFGFKVVVKEGMKLMSCTKAGLSVQYITDKFVSPRSWGGPLTVFESKFLAVGFCEKLLSTVKEQNIRVYRCEYVPTIVQHVWRYRDFGLKYKHVSELPEKSVLAKRVKLLKRVI